MINCNQTKYLKQTTTGDKVPNWLIVNTDIRKLERICQGKVPPKGQIQQPFKEYDEIFSGTREQTKTDSIYNPVRKFWEQKEISFPGKAVLRNRSENYTSTSVPGVSATGCSSQLLLFDEPTNLEEEQSHLERGLTLSLKTCPNAEARCH